MCFVKDELFAVGGVMKVNVTQDLISWIKGWDAKCVTDLEEEKALGEGQKLEKAKIVSDENKRQEKKTLWSHHHRYYSLSNEH